MVDLKAWHEAYDKYREYVGEHPLMGWSRDCGGVGATSEDATVDAVWLGLSVEASRGRAGVLIDHGGKQYRAFLVATVELAEELLESLPTAIETAKKAQAEYDETQ